MGKRFTTWLFMLDHEQKMNYGLTLMAIGTVALILILFFLGAPHDEVQARNRVDQRNHQRDRIECTSKGGLLGQGGWTQDDGYSICHVVDSLIVLNGPRETY